MNRGKSATARLRLSRAIAPLVFGLLCGIGQQAIAAGTLLIDAFRVRGPNGANDEYVQIYNNGIAHTVASISGTGYAVAASDGVVRCTIPNGTVIPKRGHFLCTNSVGFSLGTYPAGNATIGAGDATFATDIGDQAGIALFNNNTGGGSFSLANRFDAVGPTGEANTLYREGAGLPALTPFSIDYSWVRDTCGKGGAVNLLGPCTISTPKDSGDNASDFYFVDTNGTSAGGGQRLGAPGPQGLASPVYGSASIASAALDSCSAETAAPNLLRDPTSVPASNSTFGTIEIRRTFTNNTGAPITRLRFRVIDLDTFPAASGFADLRPISSSTTFVTVDRAPCAAGTSSVTVLGTTLEQAPSQPNGGGFYSTMTVGAVTSGVPLANGASINVRFVMGIQQTGDFRIAFAAEALPDGGALLQIQCHTEGCATPPALMIDAFRVHGPNAENDEYVQIYNKTGVGHMVSAFSGTGYGIAASDGVVRCTIPNGTIIPNRGHFLCTHSGSFSLGTYPAGSSTIGTGDATFATDIGDQAGIAVFNNNSGGLRFNLANRLDAVGPTGEPDTLYREGAGLPALTPFSIDYSWVRDICGRDGLVNAIGPCPALAGLPIDSNDNAADFFFVDTNGTSAGGGQRLGAPGPQGLNSPVFGSAAIAGAALDTCAADPVAPNLVRDFTSNPASNSTFGTIDIRRTFTNNTGAPITRLRFRVIDLDTFPAASGYSDLRPITSPSVVVTVDRPPCGAGTGNVTVQGTTLEQAPFQPNGGGFYSTMSVGSISTGTPLANGASVDVRFVMGIQQTGLFRVGLVAEALPNGGAIFQINGHTDAPMVASINRVNSTPSNAASVQYMVTFTQNVGGVNAADFSLTAAGSVAGAFVSSVSGSGTTYTVTVNTGTGNGTLRLDVVDNDSIVNGSAAALGGGGAGNGNFAAGQVYFIVKNPPKLTPVYMLLLD